MGLYDGEYLLTLIFFLYVRDFRKNKIVTVEIYNSIGFNVQVWY